MAGTHSINCTAFIAHFFFLKTLCVCAHVCGLQWRPAEGTDLLELELLVVVSAQGGCWEPNSCPLQEQQMSLTGGLSR